VTPRSYTFQNVDLSNIAQAYVTYDVFYQAAAHKMTATLNGHAETLTEPFSGNTGYQWSYMVQPIPLSDLTNGSNSFQLADAASCSGNDCPAVANIDLELVLKDGTPITSTSTSLTSSTTGRSTSTTTRPSTTTTRPSTTTTTTRATTTTTTSTTTTTICHRHGHSQVCHA
jgi:hypothetical protein